MNSSKKAVAIFGVFVAGVMYGRKNPNEPKHINQQIEDRAKRPKYVGYSMEEYVVSTRSEAFESLLYLKNIAQQYDYATVADYYETIGIFASEVDHRYGWTKRALAAASVKSTHGGYLIKLPQPLKI